MQNFLNGRGENKYLVTHVVIQTIYITVVLDQTQLPFVNIVANNQELTKQVLYTRFPQLLVEQEYKFCIISRIIKTAIHLKLSYQFLTIIQTCFYNSD